MVDDQNIPHFQYHMVKMALDKKVFKIINSYLATKTFEPAHDKTNKMTCEGWSESALGAHARR